ncbi:hypothetical protein [Mycoplasma zalophi]|uniref:DUF3899 domain-containing protein n=1 Tax=Mycoplasma zalophi TaxID=191287 RepID=A0ABS6DQ88_9MOLU|nr:hypothetical protein [Mycoplasma zalophi]MBU4691312.1 hypothetical protein [Mycoplasma zalophi]MBU4692482.1 hypothetical protein [Mycoplasma zalophi]
MKKNHFKNFYNKLKTWIIKGFNLYTISFLVINILIYIFVFLTLAYWLKDSILIDENNVRHTFKNTKSISNSLTVANVMIFSINALSLMIRKGFGSGLKKILQNVFDTFNFKKQNEMLKKRNMSQHELKKLENQKPKKESKIHGKPEYKSSSFIFWTLIFITIFIQILLIPYMI